MFTHLHLHLAPHTTWRLQRRMLGRWGPRGISHSGTSHSSLPCVILNYSVKHFLLHNTHICVRSSKRWHLSLHESSFCSKSERILERTITTFLSARARGMKQKWQAQRGVQSSLRPSTSARSSFWSLVTVQPIHLAMPSGSLEIHRGENHPWTRRLHW